MIQAETEPSATNDQELVNRFLAGDADAFVAIISRHRVKIFVIALRLLKNHADAEEITQDTFIRAHSGLSAFRGEASLSTWLCRIASNLATNRYWYFSRRQQKNTLSLDYEAADGAKLSDLCPSEDPSPAQDCCQAEFLGMVKRCLERLDPGHRIILQMRNGRSLPYSAIAEELGIKVGTVKSRVARARDSLRRRIADIYPEFPADAQPEAWFEPRRAGPGLRRVSGPGA